MKGCILVVFLKGFVRVRACLMRRWLGFGLGFTVQGLAVGNGRLVPPSFWFSSIISVIVAWLGLLLV